MIFFSIDTQRGQALLETIFICMILTTLLLAIQFSGHFRTRTLELLGESSYQTFLKAEPISERYTQENVRSVKQGGLLESYTEELLNVYDQGMITIQRATNQATDRRLPANRIFNALSLQRTSYLYVQDGHGRSDREVQSRIGRSKAAWRDVAIPTQQLLKPHLYPLQKIDSPWRRGKIQTDWLSDWASLSPRTPKLSIGRN